MLQIKTWSWNTSKPHGKTHKDIEKEINLFLKKHNIRPENFNIFYIDHGVMFATALYNKRKSSIN